MDNGLVNLRNSINELRHRIEALEGRDNDAEDPESTEGGSLSTEDAWIIYIDGAAHKVTQAVHGEFARMRQLLRDAGRTGDDSFFNCATDLVTRLHATSKKFPDEFGMLCLDAKAEIERLKAENKSLIVQRDCWMRETDILRNHPK